MNVRFFCLFFMFTTLFMGASAWASLPAQASLSGFEDWSTGEMNGLALNADGHLTLAPQIRRLAQDFPGPIIDAVRAKDGTIFFTTPAPARVWSFDGKNEPKKLLELDRTLITRLYLHKADELIALSGPEGGVHFIPITKPWQARFVPIENAQLLMDVVQTSFGLFVVGGGEVGGLPEVRTSKKSGKKHSLKMP